MTDWSLRILSGSHEGAELALDPGSYSLGQNDDCDLALMDDGLADEQLIIEITDAGITLQNKTPENPLFVGGKQVADNDVAVSAFNVITIAGLHFAFGPAEDEWPELQLSNINEASDSDDAGEDLPVLEEEAEVTATPSDESTSEEITADTEDSKPESKAASVPSFSYKGLPDFGALLQKLRQLSPVEIKNHIKSNPMLWGFGTGISLLLIGTLSLFIAAFSGPEIAPKPPVDYPMLAREIKHQYSMNDVKIESVPDSAWITVSGYVSTSEQKELLESELKANEVPFNSDIVVIAEMMNNASAALDLYGYKGLELAPGPQAGVLLMKGYMEKAGDIDAVKMLLKQEVHGLLSIINKVEHQTLRMHTLKGLLKGAGLARLVRVSAKSGTLKLQGTLQQPPQYARLKDVVTNFRSQYGEQPKLKITVKMRRHAPHRRPARHTAGARTNQNPALSTNSTVMAHAPALGTGTGAGTSMPHNMAPQAPELPVLNIRGVNMGAIPYVIMGNGGKYLPGAQLENGYILEEINIDYLILNNGINQIKYPLGGYYGHGR